MPASQAGRRRFDPGRPLHSFACKSEQLATSSENREVRDGSLSPTYHPKGAEDFASPPREALAASAFQTLCSTVSVEALFQRIRRQGERNARHWFSIAINPERFVEPLKADAGASAGELEGGESTSGLEPSRAESRSRGDEAMEVGGTAWRSARIE